MAKPSLYPAYQLIKFQVRIIGVEPTCLAAPDPKSGASANFAISAEPLRCNKDVLQTGGKIKE